MNSPTTACLMLLSLAAAGVAGETPPAPITARSQHVERALARAAFFRDGRVFSQVSIEYGAPQWSDAFEKAAAAAKPGDRVRLGSNKWATLESWIPLAAGAVKIPAGEHVLGLVRGEGGADSWKLLFLDPVAMRAGGIDAAYVAESKGGIEVPLAPTPASAPAPALRFDLNPAKDGSSVELAIAFGPHRLGATLAPDFTVKPTAPCCTPGDKKALAPMLELVGRWMMAGPDGAPTAELVLDIHETSTGNAIYERVFADADHEMLSVYHVEDGRIVMTHYCAKANRPRLIAEPSANGELAFRCDGGGGMRCGQDGHIHAASYRHTAKDRLSVKYRFLEADGTSEDLAMDLVRQPAAPAGS